MPAPKVIKATTNITVTKIAVVTHELPGIAVAMETMMDENLSELLDLQGQPSQGHALEALASSLFCKLTGKLLN